MDLIASNMRKVSHKYWHLISISCPDTPTQVNSLINERTAGVLKLQGCNKVLSLQFDDITEKKYEDCLSQGKKYTLFSHKQAEEVIDFIKELQNEQKDSDLVIHCDAGISRSGAIAQFVSDFLKIPFLDSHIHPNSYVRRMLWRVIDERIATDRFKNIIMV
jgi:predicted protein tyrosine phosphatase